MKVDIDKKRNLGNKSKLKTSEIILIILSVMTVFILAFIFMKVLEGNFFILMVFIILIYVIFSVSSKKLRQNKDYKNENIFNETLTYQEGKLIYKYTTEQNIVGTTNMIIISIIPNRIRYDADKECYEFFGNISENKIRGSVNVIPSKPKILDSVILYDYFEMPIRKFLEKEGINVNNIETV